MADAVVAYSIFPMELFQLEAFLAVVREGSWRRPRRSIAPSRPSARPSKTGRRDRPAALDRSSRRGVLTDAGRVLADHAERLVNLRQRAMAALMTSGSCARDA